MTTGAVLGQIDDWKAAAQASLPPATDALARNAAITATYARWYLRHRDLFKWAGMAAFASHQVGIALEIDQFTAATIPDLTIVRETNNVVYDDIAWAHLAYEAGGSRAVEDALAAADPARRERFALVVDGFRTIDQGRSQIAAGATRAGRDLVWKGNLLVLQHEQFRTVQPQFEKLSEEFSWALSLATSLEFHPDRHGANWADVSWFTWYMWTVGLVVLLRTMSPPNIVLPEHRWFWIRTRLYPLWQSLDASDRWIDDELGKLAGAGAASEPPDTPDTRPSPGRDAPPPPRPSD